MSFKEIKCDSSSSKDRKIPLLDLTKLKSRELEKQQAETVSRNLDEISPSMYQTYKWFLRQKNPLLSGEDLEDAIWELHEYRQNPDKTMVAPDKSEAQTLVGQASHWSSSDTLVSSDKVQTESQDGERLKEKLRESLRSVVQEYRQEGKVRSTAPAFSNMTEDQILLEVLSHSDWSSRLQKQGIEVNKSVLWLISQKLERMNSPLPSDYNPAARNFMDTLHLLDKLKSKDLTALQVEPVGLKGGGYYRYDPASQQHYGRIMTLRDPKGNEHTVKHGQYSEIIAEFTDKKIERYKTQYAQQYREYRTEHGPYVTDEDILNYNEATALTTSEVDELKEGDILHGWICTSLKYFPLQKTVYCTDQGTEINALDFSAYKSVSREQHDYVYPSSRYYTLKDPTPTYNCFGHTFIDGQAFLLSGLNDEMGEHDAIPTILEENGYYHVVDEKQAQKGDIVVYYDQKNGSILHTAKVIAIRHDGITLESKLGNLGVIWHDMNDDMITDGHGEPFIYHTDRKNGHKLYTREEWQTLQAQAIPSSSLAGSDSMVPAAWQRWAEEAKKATQVRQDQEDWADGLSVELNRDWKAWLEKVRQDPTVSRTKRLTPELVRRLQGLEARKRYEQTRMQLPTNWELEARKQDERTRRWYLS